MNPEQPFLPIPNVDALSMEELEEFERKLHRLHTVVTNMRRARFHREHGDIFKRMAHEAEAEYHYNRLPEELKW